MKLNGGGSAAAVVAVIVAAVPAGAAAGRPGEFSLLGSMLQMIASLALVVGVIFLVSHFAGRWMKSMTPGGVSRYIRIVETRHLGPKKSLMLLEVGGEYLLVGNSADGMQLIKQVDMLEEIEVIGPSESAWSPSAGGEKMRDLLSKLSVTFSRPLIKNVQKC